jgi:hypothetical protein
LGFAGATGRRQYQRRARLIDENAVGFVDNSEIEPTQHQFALALQTS